MYKIIITDKDHKLYGKKLTGSIIFHDVTYSGNGPDLMMAVDKQGEKHQFHSTIVDMEHYHKQERSEVCKELGFNVGDVVSIVKGGSGSFSCNFILKDPHVITKISSCGHVEFDDNLASCYKPEMEKVKNPYHNKQMLTMANKLKSKEAVVKHLLKSAEQDKKRWLDNIVSDAQKKLGKNWQIQIKIQPYEHTKAVLFETESEMEYDLEGMGYDEDYDIYDTIEILIEESKKIDEEQREQEEYYQIRLDRHVVSEALKESNELIDNIKRVTE